MFEEVRKRLDNIGVSATSEETHEMLRHITNLEQALSGCYIQIADRRRAEIMALAAGLAANNAHVPSVVCDLALKIHADLEHDLAKEAKHES